MGSRATSARHPFARRVPGVAVPALCGIAAAAFALAGAPAALAATSARPVAQHSAATARTVTAVRAALPAAKRATAVSRKYTVKSGDTLSGIAQHVYGSQNDWPVLYWANHSQIKYANEIGVGQVLQVPAKPAKIPAPPAVLGPPPPPAPAPVVAQSAAPAPVVTQRETPAPVRYAPPAAAASTVTSAVQSAPRPAAGTVSTAGNGSFQACVIARESGGNSQVMNATGHYGLYQFSASTWAAYGGNSADFGHASVAEQNQVFNNAIAAGGQSNWAPYDGC